jgi:hypothetical protein
MTVDRLRHRRRAFAAVSASIVMALSAACTQHPASTSHAGTGSSVTVATSVPPVAPTTRTETFVDTSRRTPANGNYPGAASRSITVRFLIPPTSGRLPLILWSHGFGVPLGEDDGTLAPIVSAGYLVAMIDAPFASHNSPGPAMVDGQDEPGDISFVLSRILDASADPTSWLRDRVDSARVGAAGQSRGGYTTLGLINSCCRDTRIKALAVHAPALDGRKDLPGDWFLQANPPLLVLAGTNDDLYQPAHDFYGKATEPKYFVTSINGPHTEIERGTNAQKTALGSSMAAFFDLHLSGDPTAMSRLDQFGNTSGVTSCTDCKASADRTR